MTSVLPLFVFLSTFTYLCTAKPCTVDTPEVVQTFFDKYLLQSFVDVVPPLYSCLKSSYKTCPGIYKDVTVKIDGKKFLRAANVAVKTQNDITLMVAYDITEAKIDFDETKLHPAIKIDTVTYGSSKAISNLVSEKGKNILVCLPGTLCIVSKDGKVIGIEPLNDELRKMLESQTC